MPGTASEQIAPQQAASVQAFRRQAAACRALNSPFYAELAALMADEIEAGRPLAGMVAGYALDPQITLLPLRVLGAVHRLVLDQPDSGPARHWPSAGSAGDAPAALAEGLALLAQAPGLVEDYLSRAVQTNEVQRAAVLAPGFLTAAAVTGRPLALYEIGASAGLNLAWDGYRYDWGWRQWGSGQAPLSLSAEWTGRQPPLPDSVAVVGRAGCDPHPVELRDAASRQRLLSYVWPDQPARIDRLRRAMAAALAGPSPALARARAIDWLPAQLAARPGDAAAIVYHSVVWPYVEPAEQAALVRLLAEQGAKAGRGNPLGWLRMEMTADGATFDLRLTLWPEGRERVLARCHPHGNWLIWA